MKKIELLVIIAPLFVFAFLVAYIFTKEAWCIGDDCDSSAAWFGQLTGEWIVFYGIPVTGYLIYRKMRQRRKQNSLSTPDV